MPAGDAGARRAGAEGRGATVVCRSAAGAGRGTTRAGAGAGGAAGTSRVPDTAASCRAGAGASGVGEPGRSWNGLVTPPCPRTPPVPGDRNGPGRRSRRVTHTSRRDSPAGQPDEPAGTAAFAGGGVSGALGRSRTGAGSSSSGCRCRAVTGSGPSSTSRCTTGWGGRFQASQAPSGPEPQEPRARQPPRSRAASPRRGVACTVGTACRAGVRVPASVPRESTVDPEGDQAGTNTAGSCSGCSGPRWRWARAGRAGRASAGRAATVRAGTHGAGAARRRSGLLVTGAPVVPVRGAAGRGRRASEGRASTAAPSVAPARPPDPALAEPSRRVAPVRWAWPGVRPPSGVPVPERGVPDEVRGRGVAVDRSPVGLSVVRRIAMAFSPGKKWPQPGKGLRSRRKIGIRTPRARLLGHALEGA